MASENDYEMPREINMQENNLMMVQLGLIKPSDSDDYDDGGGGDEDDDNDDDEESLNHGYESSSGCSEISTERPPIKHNVYGSIEGVSVGDWWLTSRECWQAGVHRPPAVGALVHCGPDGAYSVTLSDGGGDDGDVDGGERFSLSTGGGTAAVAMPIGGVVEAAPALSYDTVALVASVQSQRPVRVVRAHKLASAYAPDIGYRYDGLYDVENYWAATSKKSGATVYRFVFQRRVAPQQAPPPWLVHKILPTTLHRSVRAKFARALRNATATATAANNHKLQDTLKSDVKSRRRTTATTAGVANGGGGEKHLSFEQLLQQRLEASLPSNALRMQASPSTSQSTISNHHHHVKPAKKKGLAKLFENYPFEQNHQQLVMVRNEQLTPEPDPADRLFDDDLSYLGLKRKSYQESVALGQAVTASFEAEFVKICDELCSELPPQRGLYSQPDNLNNLLQLSGAACKQLLQNRGDRLPPGDSCSKVLQRGVNHSKMTAQRRDNHIRKLQNGEGCSKMLQQSGENHSRMLPKDDGYSKMTAQRSCDQRVFDQNRKLQNGDAFSKMSQRAYGENCGRMLENGEGCSKISLQRGGSLRRMLENGEGCSKMSSQNGEIPSRMPQNSEGSSKMSMQSGEILSRLLQNDEGHSKMSTQSGENFSRKLQISDVISEMSSQRGGAAGCSRMLSNDGETPDTVQLNSNKRMRMSASEPEEFVSVSRNRRKCSKVPRKSSVVRVSDVVDGQKKTSIFEEQPEPPPSPVVCYKSANEFLNALVGGCVDQISPAPLISPAKDAEGRAKAEVVVGEVGNVVEERQEVIEDGFLGFTAQEVYAAKELSTRFADFLFRVSEHTDDSDSSQQWTGWGLVPRRSIIVNGFLIEQVQRENESAEKSQPPTAQPDDSD